MHLLTLPTALTLALPTSPSTKPKPLPLLIWHGLGDRFDADGLQSTGALAQKIHPGTFVYYIRTDDDGGNDRTNTFFGNVSAQIDDVCEALWRDPRLKGYVTEGKDEDGDGEEELRVDALGFSQGGQFLRGLAQRCHGLNVRSLVTFGSQHNGIQEFQRCGDFDFVCKGATALIKNNVWNVQDKVIPAQYYRPVNLTSGLAKSGYLKHSGFLADVNNEREEKNEGYRRRIAGLEKLVLFVFEEDETVIPLETGWFSEVLVVNETERRVVPLRERAMYKEDWLGLRALDEKGGLVFRKTGGGHMRLDDELLTGVFEEFFGPEHASKSDEAAVSQDYEEQQKMECVPDLWRDKFALPKSMRLSHDEVMAMSEEARQEYQTQLMLLELRNREKLWRSREEKERQGLKVDWCTFDPSPKPRDDLSWWQKLFEPQVSVPPLFGECMPVGEGVDDEEFHESL